MFKGIHDLRLQNSTGYKKDLKKQKREKCCSYSWKISIWTKRLKYTCLMQSQISLYVSRNGGAE